MITSPRRPTPTPPVTRQFEFTRLQDQLIARAYQAVTPIASRPLERPRTPRTDNAPSTTTFRGLRPQAEGA
jgi:hypothetical protein